MLGQNNISARGAGSPDALPVRPSAQPRGTFSQRLDVDCRVSVRAAQARAAGCPGHWAFYHLI